ncbi:hypothetical protein D5F01_LYC22379 [Larimichthys crocea]|uniref:ribonuclease H n=1 Tax=Larimichthys crocea TaxID=215358 RepID=A0A6G0HHX9_LARCR|nr:hypothetical protein D5F01_LYC22379 [Larimichthys crocea]
MTNESMLSITPDRNLMEEMLQQVQECLWSQHNTDIGLVKSAQPVRVELRPGTKPPWRPQYPLKEEAVQGIEPQIEGLLQAGVLKTTNDPQSDMPLLPTKKPDGSYRHVHDLRAINEVVIDYPADVPDPHTLLAQIPPEATCFTVIDLCGAFFSVPLAEESQGLFGFTYKGQSYEYTRLPMGFKHSPHLFNKVLKDDLEGVGSQEQTKKEEHRGATILPGDKVFVKVFRRKWFHPRREGPFQVLRSTGTAVQVEGSPTWFHVNHCIKAPEDNEGDGEQPRDTESGDDPRRNRGITTMMEVMLIMHLLQRAPRAMLASTPSTSSMLQNQRSHNKGENQPRSTSRTKKPQTGSGDPSPDSVQRLQLKEKSGAPSCFRVAAQ